MKWPQNLQKFTFMTNTTAVQKEDLEKIALSKSKRSFTTIRPVKVSFMNLRWFFNDGKNFINFAEKLNKDLPFGFYSSKFT